ncbi:MAG: sigma-70 family RNA polymerase sigma factor [Clostridia bacterium]|nr:sigma-70 family RNA polymerase sigma factor [Clostridia bacterium]
MEELIKRAQKGDQEAFTALVKSMKDDLYKIAKTRISNEDDMQDAIQETMLEMFKSIKKLRDPKLFKKWIITILINKCNRIYRRKYKTDLSYEELNFEDFITATSNDVESDLEFYELLKDLKYEERIILILYYKEEYTVKEIKSILNMKVSTINTHLFRARVKLKEKLEKGGELHG